MKKLLVQYVQHLQEQEKSRATIAKYTHDIKVFLRWLEERQGGIGWGERAGDVGGMERTAHIECMEQGVECDSLERLDRVDCCENCDSIKNLNPADRPEGFTKTDVVAYKQWLIGQYAPASVNSMLAALSAFLSYTGHHDCKVRPLKIQRPLFYPEEKELSRAEYFRLLDTAHATNKTLWLIMQTLCAVGLRVSELQFVTVESLHTGRIEVSCKGKRRVALLPKTLCKKLLRYVQARRIFAGAVFVTAGGAPIDRSHIWAAMKKLCARARVCAAKVFPHNLRHLFARTYYNVTKDITRLADLLGHSNINTTRIYTLTDGHQQVLQIEKLGLIQ